MKKKIVNEENKKKAKQESPEATGTEPVGLDETTTGTESMSEVKKVDKLTIGFPNEDLNKVVAKINEIIEHVN